MNHPIYRKAFPPPPPEQPAVTPDINGNLSRQDRKLQQRAVAEAANHNADEIALPAWFVTLRYTLIFFLFIFLHTMVSRWLFPRAGGSRDAYREQMMSQMCPPGIDCEYQMPGELPFEDMFT
jgi:hypothetical protein